MKKKIALIYGGESVEHDISIITALQVVKSLPPQLDFVLIYIDRTGKWWTADNLDDIKIYEDFRKFAKSLRQVSLVMGENNLFIKKHGKFVYWQKLSAVLNCCHGRIGEDGSLQGVFRACKIAQSSAGVLSSALCMDKALMKDVFIANGIETPEFVCLKKDDFNASIENQLEEEACHKTDGKTKDERVQMQAIQNITEKLEFPLIVKPANLGSSIAISVCKNESELAEAIELSFNFDKKVVIEKLVENLQEFNCACLSYKGDFVLSSVSEVTNKGEIYSFDDKYLSRESKNQEVEKELAQKIKDLTEKVYKTFDCQGIVRVDFLFDQKTKTLYVNEINSIPGSLAFYLFKDVTFKELIFAVIEQSLLDEESEEKLIKSFDSDALKTFENVSGKMKK